MPGSKLGNGSTVLSIREQPQNRGARYIRDRSDAPIQKDKLADSWMNAAELLVVRLVWRPGQWKFWSCHPQRRIGTIGIEQRRVLVAAKGVQANVLFADDQRV